MIRNRETAQEAARAYAWARQDQAATGQDMQAADGFAAAFADAWQAHHDGWATGPNLRSAWADYQRDGTVRAAHECALCGATAQTPLPADPTQRRCQRCTQGRPSTPAPVNAADLDATELAHLFAELLGNTGGNPIGELLVGKTDIRVNLPLWTLETCARTQAGLLHRLAQAGLLTLPTPGQHLAA